MTDWTQKKGYGKRDFEHLLYFLITMVRGIVLAVKGNEKAEKVLRQIVEDAFCEYRKENKENQHIE